MNQTYKILSIFAAIALLLTIGAHVYLLGPRLNRNQDLVNANKKTEEDLRSRDKTWKLDPDYFQKLKVQYERIRRKRLDGLSQVFGRSNQEFKKLVDPTNYGQTVKQWRDGLFVMSFGEAYYNTVNMLKGLDVAIDDAVFGMSPDQVVRQNQVYRKLAHLHVVRESVMLARKNGLTLSHPQMTAEWCEENALKNEFTIQPAMVAVKPVRSFFVTGEKEAFLDEFPVELRVRGRLANVSRYLAALTANGRFLPVDRIVIRAVGAENYVKSVEFARRGVENRVEARIIVSGFLVHHDAETLSNKRLKIENRKPLPPDA